MAAKPVFVIIPGSFHPPASYSVIQNMIIQNGFECITVERPTNAASPPYPTSPDVDVQAIRRALETYTDVGRDVVVVMHSSGGIAGSEAMKYFAKRREGQGRVLRQVYMCAFVFQKYDSVRDLMVTLPSWQIRKDEVIECVNVKEVFYGDLSDEQAAPYLSLICPQAICVTQAEGNFEGWGALPSTYIYCEQDRAVSLELQQGMVTRAKERHPASFDVIESLPCSHSPFASMPGRLLELLLKAARS